MPIEDFASHLCNILTQGTGQDSTGAPAREPYAYVATNVPCIVDETGSDRPRTNDKSTQLRVGKIYFFTNYNLTIKHRIEVIDPTYPKGKRQLVITAVSNPVTRNHHWEVDFTEQPV